MNAAELNTELNKLCARALREGVFPGKISPAEFIGILEMVKMQGNAQIMHALAVKQSQQQPIIMPPLNGHLPPPPGGRG